MATLKELIARRIERIESVPADLQTAIDKQNDRLFKEILSDLNGLEIADGKVVSSTANLAKISGIIDRLKELMFQGEYVDAIKKFAGEIKIQAELNNRILALTVGTFEDNEMYTATIKQAQKNALLLLDQTAVTNNLLQPLTDIMNNAVINSVSFTDAVETLRQNMTGESALLTKYAGTYVKDAFGIADAQYVQLTAREHGIAFYRYDGDLVSDSREFCIERHGKIFHEEEIRKWGENINTRPGEFIRPKSTPVYTNSAGEKLYWEGEHYGTNSGTIFSYRGGYTCAHQLIPIATEYVPQSVKDKAQSLRYYTP